jgi:hypothetical protein
MVKFDVCHAVRVADMFVTDTARRFPDSEKDTMSLDGQKSSRKQFAHNPNKQGALLLVTMTA